MTNQTAETVRTETNVTEYRLQLRGLFGRNRKVKGLGIALRDVPVEVEKLSDSELHLLVTEALVAAKVKPGCQWKVMATPVTITRNGGPFVSRSFMMFSGECVLSGVA